MNENKLINILHEGGYSLVISNHGLHTYKGRGIADLYRILRDDKQLLNGASVADKIIGKGAAALMALGNVAKVFTDTISSSALTLLRNQGIAVTFQLEVPNIINRKGTGICPVEELCLGCRSPEECLPLLARFMSDKI